MSEQNLHVGQLRESLLGEKARTSAPPGYARASVPADKVSWLVPYEAYAPTEFTSPHVLENDCTLKPGGWADEPDAASAFARRGPPKRLSGGPVHFDARGRPLNPAGRTGTSGRGLLGKWGPNYAADPIVTRRNALTGAVEMLAIRRKDNGLWAIPGGMVDEGEDVSTTLAREFQEEAGVTLDLRDARLVYVGYVDDPRNTDHAWMETTVKHKHLPPEVAAKLSPVAGDDAVAVQWLPLTEAHLSRLHASHGAFVRRALELLSAA